MPDVDGIEREINIIQNAFDCSYGVARGMYLDSVAGRITIDVIAKTIVEH